MNAQTSALEKIFANDPRKRTREQITRIYHGLENCCRCGCGGKYHASGSRGFKMAISKMQKPDFHIVEAGDPMWSRQYGIRKSEGVTYGPNYIDIPYDAEHDKCYCLYFD